MNHKPYFIPVTFTEETNITNFNVTASNIYYLTRSKPILDIPLSEPENWVILNLQQIGFYRVNYDNKNWKLIARYLNSEQYTNIHVLNRAQIIDDSFHLMTQKKLNFSIFWELSSYLWQEKDFIAWYPMFKSLEYVSNIIPFLNAGENFLEVFKSLEKIKNLFERVAEQIYNHTAPTKYDIDKYLMQEIAKWSCIMNSTLCIEKAKNQLRLHIENPQENRITTGWHKWTYCNGLKRANYTVWNQVWTEATTKYQEKSDYTMFEFLTCIENPQILSYLQSALRRFEMDLFFINKNNKTQEMIKNQQ
ncbi:aminopeptidase N-like [Nylanderia fulva]|uniref:aminopeptidase N-like n=1 Tax=Nylanderia fulva TaxID=613905 RepID=UPI0010FB441A|nr:aminopeptidase N-like [Nylanderia fulva]